jgi:hypothetical protein
VARYDTDARPGVTVTVVVMVNVSSVTVIVADPTARALIFPDVSTCATEVAEELKLGGATDRVVEPSDIVPVMTNLSGVPTATVGFVGEADIETRTGGDVRDPPEFVVPVPPVVPTVDPPLEPPPQPASQSIAITNTQGRPFDDELVLIAPAARPCTKCPSGASTAEAAVPAHLVNFEKVYQL